MSTPSTTQLTQRLITQIETMLAAGHLRPGYVGTGLYDQDAVKNIGDNLQDYFHHPGDTLVTLIRALPFLPQALQDQVKSYINTEFSQYSPINYSHIGWRDGTPRETYDIPPEVAADAASMGPTRNNSDFAGWHYNPYTFYTLWKYALVNGNAAPLFNQAKPSFPSTLPAGATDEYLAKMPHVLNTYLAAFRGYLELEKLAGDTSDITQSDQYPNYQRLLDLRVTSFTTTYPDPTTICNQCGYYQALNAARNFMFLTPELAQYLGDHIAPNVQAALAEYNSNTPYWFVSKFDTTFGEGTIQPLYDYHALFQAKAMILHEPYVELVKYLDVPAFARGDLFYIDNLVAALEAADSGPIKPDLDLDNDVDSLDLFAFLPHFNNPFSTAQWTGGGVVNIFDFNYLLQWLQGILP